MSQTFEVTIDVSDEETIDEDKATFQAAELQRDTLTTDGMIAYDAEGERRTTFDRDQLIGVSMSGGFR